MNELRLAQNENIQWICIYVKNFYKLEKIFISLKLIFTSNFHILPGIQWLVSAQILWS